MIETIRTKFVAASGDDWYRRRQDDDEGKFFRSVADQGPRKGEGGATRQGLYGLTADGALLGYRNSADAGAVKELLQKIMDAWAKLPESARKPKKLAAAPAARDARFARALPEGAIVLRVRARELEGDAKSGYRRAAPREGSAGLSSLDHLWLQRDEWTAMIHERARPGESWELPGAIVRRLARFHLVDDTRGEPPFWRTDDVREAKATLTAARRAKSILTLKLAGRVKLLAEDEDRSFDAELSGTLEADVARGAFTRIDLIAIGLHHGEGPYTPLARPGKTPLGIAFELADMKEPADKIAPQAARDLREYLAGE